MGLIKKQKIKKVENNIIVHDFVSDVETYEVEFSDDDKIKMKNDADILYCNYSGLPSIYTYEEQK